MALRRFDHLATELSVALGRLTPRYALWLRLQELGFDPMDLERDQAVTFLERHLDGFLDEFDLNLTGRARRRLLRAVAHFDPLQPTPEEILERIFDGADRVER